MHTRQSTASNKKKDCTNGGDTKRPKVKDYV